MIADALNAYGARRRAWSHDRAATLGASAVGACLRRSWFEKHGTAPDEGHAETWGYMQRGAVFEDHFFVPALRAHYGPRLRFAGDNQRTFFDDVAPLSATPDGLLRDVTLEECVAWGIPPTDCVLIECKSIGAFKAAELPKPEHEFQVQVQMGLVRQHGRYQPDAAIIVYTSAFDWSRISEHAVSFDPAVFERARNRARVATSARSAARVVAEGRISGRECRYCPYLNSCESAERFGTSELPAAAGRPAASAAD